MIRKFNNFDIECVAKKGEHTTLVFIRVSENFNKIRGNGEIKDIEYKGRKIWSYYYPCYYPEEGLALPGKDKQSDYLPFYCPDIEELSIVLNLLKQLDEYMIKDVSLDLRTIF